MGEIEIGTCECCGKQNTALTRKYFRYPFRCECHSPEHFILIRHCEDCEPEEPQETKVCLKTKDLRNPFTFAFRIMQREMQKTRDVKGEIYDVWESNLAMMIYDAVPNMTTERANEIAAKWLDRLFEINSSLNQKFNC